MAYAKDFGTSPDLTSLLIAWSAGDEGARDRLIPALYPELRELASSYLRRERPGHTLDTSALVHEAYLRLIDQNRVSWQSRGHFLAIAAQAMRRVLVDHARRYLYAKRGAGQVPLSLDQALVFTPERAPEIEALDEALTRLEALAPRQARIVELRFFGGLTSEEIGAILGLSVPTVTREWRLARLWLYRSLSPES